MSSSHCSSLQLYWPHLSFMQTLCYFSNCGFCSSNNQKQWCLVVNPNPDLRTSHCLHMSLQAMPLTLKATLRFKIQFKNGSTGCNDITAKPPQNGFEIIPTLQEDVQELAESGAVFRRKVWPPTCWDALTLNGFEGFQVYLWQEWTGDPLELVREPL